MKTRRIELIYFEGCPNVSQARENLRAAIEVSGYRLTWSERDLLADSTPEGLRRFASPTVLVDGEDVTGEALGATAIACRAEGAPSVTSIAEKLR